MSTRGRLNYIMLGCVGPFAFLVLLVGAPVMLALYWCGRFWAKVPIIKEIFDEDEPPRAVATDAEASKGGSPK